MTRASWLCDMTCVLRDMTRVLCNRASDSYCARHYWRIVWHDSRIVRHDSCIMIVRHDSCIVWHDSHRVLCDMTRASWQCDMSRVLCDITRVLWDMTRVLCDMPRALCDMIIVWIVAGWKNRHHKRQNVRVCALAAAGTDTRKGQTKLSKKMSEKLINLWKKCHFWTSGKIKVWLKQGKRARAPARGVEAPW